MSSPRFPLRAAAVLSLAALAALAPVALPQESELLRIEPAPVPGEPFHNNFFGQSLALDGGWLLVADHAGGPYGEVHVFRSEDTGWVATQVLEGEDSSDWYATSLDADDGTLVVTSLFAGRVDVYELQTSGSWVHVARLLPPQPCTQGFGTAVVSGDTLAVFSRDLCADSQSSGRVHVYEREQGTWSRRQLLQFDPPPSLVAAGAAGPLRPTLDLDGDLLAVATSSQRGGIVVYRRQAGAFRRVDLLLDPESSYPAGAIAVDGTTIAAGFGSHAGAVTVFEQVGPDQWAKVARLRSSDAFAENNGGQFGSSVALDGPDLVVGGPRQRTAGPVSSGTVYHFRKRAGAWPATETRAFVSSSPAQSDVLGIAVDVESGTIVGGLGEWGPGGHPGAVLVFGVEQGATYCGPLSLGPAPPAWLRVLGSDRVEDGNLLLDVRRAQPFARGRFLLSARAVHRPFPGGTLCVGAPVIALAPADTDDVGHALLRLDPGRVSHLWSPGQRLHVQHLSRASGEVAVSNAVGVLLR